jgi:cytochrome c2
MRGGALAPLGLAAALLSTGCGAEADPQSAVRRVVGGDPAVGRALVADPRHGCGACHAIPDIPGARGVVGPPLDGFAARSYIAGQFPNRPGTLVAFLQDPPRLVPRTAMPAVGLDADGARHVAAWLYTLRPAREVWW